MLFGAKGRVFQLRAVPRQARTATLRRRLAKLLAHLVANADAIEQRQRRRAASTRRSTGSPTSCTAQWRRQWINAFEKGTRQRVPALVDVNNPGLTGGVQNQPDFQAGSVDHRTHFASEVPRLVRQAMAEYCAADRSRVHAGEHLHCATTPRTSWSASGSVTDDAEAVATHLRGQGKKVGVVSIKLLQPLPGGRAGRSAARQEGRHGARALRRDRADQPGHAGPVQGAWRTRAASGILASPRSRRCRRSPRRSSAWARTTCSRVTWSPRSRTWRPATRPFVYLGSQFFAKNPSPRVAAMQDRLRAAYPETELMALETEPNPRLLPPEAFRIRFHSVGGYGTIATGKLLTDILAGVLGPAFEVRAQVRLGEERRADQLLHHPQPGAGEAHQRRAGRRRDRRSRPTTRCSATPIRCADW